MIFCLSHGMAIFDGNFHPMGVVASLAMLYYLEAHMKKKFLKLAKKQAKHSPKTIGRIVRRQLQNTDFTVKVFFGKRLQNNLAHKILAQLLAHL